MAKKQKKKNIAKKVQSEAVAKKSGSHSWLASDKVALAIALLSCIAYYIWSHMSPGFYQHDEVGHLNNMKSFWYNPDVILGNWPKPGYKLIFVVPALLGGHFVTIMNCAMSALAGWLAFKITKELGSTIAVLAGILVLSQPMFFELSFRNYSEVTTSVLLAGGVWAHYKNKWSLATFLLAYVCTIRQEMLPLLAAYGVYLMIGKKWLSILIGSVPILALNTWGAIKTGDPIYLLSQLLGKSEALAKEYPRQGFWHYLSTSEAIFGGLALLLFVLYFSTIKNKKDFHWVVVIPVLYFFAIHTLFNIQSWEVGPATGGNLRYMGVISPLLAVASVLGLERVMKSENTKIPLIAGGIFVLITAIFFTFENNNIRLTEDRNWMPMIVTGLAAMVAFFLSNKIGKTGTVLSIAGIALIQLFSSATTFDYTPEEKAIERAAKYYNKQIAMPEGKSGKEISENDHVYFDHIVLSYFTDKCRDAFPGPNLRPRKGNAETAEVGSIFFYDTHYSYRPRSHKDLTKEEYYTSQPNRFKRLQEYISSDRRFKIAIYKKIAP